MIDRVHHIPENVCKIHWQNLSNDPEVLVAVVDVEK